MESIPFVPRGLRPTIDPGLRVQVRRMRPGFRRDLRGQWGTVIRGRGLGKILVRLDDGTEWTVAAGDLWFTPISTLCQT